MKDVVMQVQVDIMIEFFLHFTLTWVDGEPTYKTIASPQLQLNTNTIAVNSSQGNLGYLALTVDLTT